MREPVTVGELVPAIGTQRFRCPREDCGAEFEGPTLRPSPDVRPAVCPACRAKEEAAAAARRAQESAVIAAEEGARRRARRVEDLAVPALFAEATIDGFELFGTPAERLVQQRAQTVARRWASTWPDVPVIQIWRGGPGTGKGHLAWALARLLVVTWTVRVRIVKLADLVRELRAGWGRAGDDGGALELYRGLELLVVDEVSRHAFYGEPRQHLYDVVDHRLEQVRPTVLTSNEDPAGLAQLLGPALLSRVNGAGGVIDFGEADYRARPRGGHG